MPKPGRPCFKFGLDNGVGFRTWEVREATESDTGLMEGAMGRCLRRGPHRRIILIDPTIDTEFERDSTIFHEVLHAAWPGGGGYESGEEERVVTALEKRLWPLLAAHGLRWPEQRKRR